MSDWVYTDTVKEHFKNPRNILEDEENYEYDGKGRTGNIKCGDEMIIWIKVDKATETIADCKWKTYGCASAIASTSIMSEMVIGMKVDEAYRLNASDINKMLGGLPEHKIHCSVLGDKALRVAIADYYERSGQPEKIVREDARVICQCMNVTDHDIEHAVLEGARTWLDLQEHTKMGTVCGQCELEATGLMHKFIKQHFEQNV